ncbi:MAG TPA: glycosyltransferase family 2 protein, partial [Myxococcales bacterium]|nr:glycosyltransferase family 2 protein [Myxococcales bacterium]
MTLLADSDPLETAAIEDFRKAHPSLQLGPIAVVIPSYREAGSIAGTLERIPKEIAGHAVRTLVVVDGPDDGAARIAVDHGAYATGTGGSGPRGQGAALRLGYRIAVAHGAAYLVTIDADGQYLPEEIPAVLAPLLAGEADFVSGSRRLGENGSPDRVRTLGVYVYAAVISALTGRHVTDPAFGLRAMTAEVARTVTLRQPQYQASELLIGAAMHGYRLAERPGTIR